MLYGRKTVYIYIIQYSRIGDSKKARNLGVQLFLKIQIIRIEVNCTLPASGAEGPRVLISPVLWDTFQHAPYEDVVRILPLPLLTASNYQEEDSRLIPQAVNACLREGVASGAP